MARRQILSLSERESLLALPDDELTLTQWRILVSMIWRLSMLTVNPPAVLVLPSFFAT